MQVVHLWNKKHSMYFENQKVKPTSQTSEKKCCLVLSGIDRLRLLLGPIETAKICTSGWQDFPNVKQTEGASQNPKAFSPWPGNWSKFAIFKEVPFHPVNLQKSKREQVWLLRLEKKLHMWHDLWMKDKRTLKMETVLHAWECYRKIWR